MSLLKRFESRLPSTGVGAALVSFIAIAGLGLAILSVQRVTGTERSFAGPRYDGYWELGINWIRGYGYTFGPDGAPAFHRPPLVPGLFGPLTLLPETMQRPGLILLQSLMLAVMCGLTFDLTRRVLGPRPARWSLVLLLGYPFLYFDVGSPLNIVTQAMCVTAVVYLLGRELLLARSTRKLSQSRQTDLPWAGADGSSRNPAIGSENRDVRSFSWVPAVLLGLAAAGAILTHGTMLLAVPLLVAGAGLVGVRLGSLRVIKVGVAAGLIAMLTLAPWTCRNWRVTGRFIPVVGGAGLQYFVGIERWSYDESDGQKPAWRRIVSASLGRDIPDTTELIHFWGFKDPALDAIANQRMVDDLRAHPGFFAKRVVLNAVEFYAPSVRELLMPRTAPTMPYVARRAAMSIVHVGLLVMGGLGIWRSFYEKKSGPLWLATACIAVLAGGYLPFVAGISHCQYCLQTLPLLAFLAAALVKEPSQESKERAASTETSRLTAYVPRPLGLRPRRRLSQAGS